MLENAAEAFGADRFDSAKHYAGILELPPAPSDVGIPYLCSQTWKSDTAQLNSLVFQDIGYTHQFVSDAQPDGLEPSLCFDLFWMLLKAGFYCLHKWKYVSWPRVQEGAERLEHPIRTRACCQTSSVPERSLEVAADDDPKPGIASVCIQLEIALSNLLAKVALAMLEGTFWSAVVGRNELSTLQRPMNER